MPVDLDPLFARYRRDAVLLHRPYPPHVGPRGNSKLGGLPNLPAHHELPRTSEGVPLHFLAQIDCAELPFASPLPDRGTLFFFGRDDAEQVWNYKGPASDDCRVLYLLDAFAATPPRAPPLDLRPIGDKYPRPAWRELLREGEKGPAVHIEWPVRPLRIDSWPDGLPEDPRGSADWRTRLLGLLRSPTPAETWQDEERRHQEYSEAAEERRKCAFTAATGELPSADESYGRDVAAARAIFANDGADAYPQHWTTIHFAARALLHRPPRLVSEDAAVTASAAQATEAWVTAAEHWLARAEAVEPQAPVPDADRTAFRTWLKTVRWPKDDTPLSATAAGIVFASLVATVRSWAGDAAQAERISASVYGALRHQFNGFSLWGVQYSQMLGHAPSAQEPLAPHDRTICLLNLASDHGLGWMFGDVGNATFWIKPDDLARRDFAKAWATIEGH